jgi:hypothetical protein
VARFSVVTKVLDVGMTVPLMVVAVATPSIGVTKVGLVIVAEVSKTNFPVPVLSATVVPLILSTFPEADAVSNVLFVNVSVPARVARRPEIGKVTEVFAVEIKVVVYAPEVVRFPPRVIVFPVLFTPVPPY